jgi:transcriptional regulator with XRE-family HTH domain
MEVKDKIYTYRVLNRLKQQDIADQLGVSQAYYSLVEAGKRIPSDDLLHKINNIINEVKE